VKTSLAANSSHHSWTALNHPVFPVFGFVERLVSIGFGALHYLLVPWIVYWLPNLLVIVATLLLLISFGLVELVRTFRYRFLSYSRNGSGVDHRSTGLKLRF
jgi:hypothetical protein